MTQIPRYLRPTCDDSPDDLCSKNVGVAVMLAKRMMKGIDDRRFSYDDVLGTAMLSLAKAVKSFDPSRGYKLTTYLTTIFRNEMVKLFSESSGVYLPRKTFSSVQAFCGFRDENGRLPTFEEAPSILGRKMRLSQQRYAELVQATILSQPVTEFSAMKGLNNLIECDHRLDEFGSSEEAVEASVE
jgi:DNA-directed RNA polymerase specialized sigma subunit